MRSSLTVLGVVIGITSIVGMTSLIRGFDQALRDSIRELGPNTIYVQKFGALSMSSGASFLEVMKRPNLTIEDARAIARDSPSVDIVDVWLGATGSSQSRLTYAGQRTKPLDHLRDDGELRSGQLRRPRVAGAFSRPTTSNIAARSWCSGRRRTSPSSRTWIRSAKRSASAVTSSPSSASSGSARARAASIPAPTISR